jgi:cytosine/adenosine deaminase-related metal-dependent hydrolase
MEVARRSPDGAGCHIHVAEDPVDVESSLSAFGKEPVPRLIQHGLLGERSLLAHGIHLHRDDYEAIAVHGGVIIHNPESNANNGVGHLDVEKACTAGCVIGLGTDGMSSSMLGALRAAFLIHRAQTGDPEAGFNMHARLFSSNVHVARRFFDEPLLGTLREGAPADAVVIDGPDTTPVSSENLFAHLVYGAGGARIRHTVARGQVLMEDFQVQVMDADEIVRRARRLSPGLWDRFRALEWGTKYLGNAE